MYRVIRNSIQTMQTNVENLLNPYRYYLSEGAKKRLRWLYILYEECGNNVSRAANKIGISREWLSKIKSKFERNYRDPRCLEPESRAPCHTSKRKKISKETEDLILKVRDQYPAWGEKKIARIIWRDYQVKVSKNTVNRYLHKHQRIDPKISERNEKAWQLKKEREKVEEINLKIKYRPPRKIKDYLPGALIEKDMKLVPKIGQFSQSSDGKYHLKDYFYFQHTFLDSFTRMRFLELVEEPSSQAAVESYQKVKQRMLFKIACFNTDNGGENEKEFSSQLQKDEIIHFWSKTATPTDNPRVERSHLTDEKEFYVRGNLCKTSAEQRERIAKWEYVGNYVRPHQALSYLTPIEFYQLWKNNPEQAYQIVEKWQTYLKKQRLRLASSRRLKKREQIEKLMQFIDAKLNKKVDLEVYKLDLAKCELCSWG